MYAARERQVVLAAPTGKAAKRLEEVVGRVAVIHHRRPDIFPVNYAVDHGSLVFRSGSGTLFGSSDGAFVAFEVDGYDTSDATAWSVVVRGVAHEVYELDDALAAMRLPLYPWHDAPKPRIMRIHPDVVSGRRFRVRGGHVTGPVSSANDQ